MKVAFDLDKTYFANPLLFDRIATRFKSAGHEVGILTGRHQDEGAETTFTPDFTIFLDIGPLPYQERAEIKAQTMRDLHIDLIFDDRAELFPKDIVALHIL